MKNSTNSTFVRKFDVPPSRSQLVMAMVNMVPNRFMACALTRGNLRAFHNPNSDRMADSINSSMRHAALPAKKKSTRAKRMLARVA